MGGRNELVTDADDSSVEEESPTQCIVQVSVMNVKNQSKRAIDFGAQG